ncbi:hypothetical protein [Klebsiella pneumoniae]|uniref:hypothetical protein n=1 Tax=Klebsiella pneumoniae TaxID=573 RepID=UPI003D33FD17
MPRGVTRLWMQSKSICAIKSANQGCTVNQYVPVWARQPSPANNYRPGLHDSNGLSIHAIVANGSGVR